MDLYKSLCIVMDSNGSLWVLKVHMRPYGSLWILMLFLRLQGS